MAKNFTSAIGKKELVYGEHNLGRIIHDQPIGQSRGHVARDFRENPLGKAWRGAGGFPAEWIVPRSEWDDRIEEAEAKKTRLSDVVRQAGLPCKDQDGTNYCWINAPTHCCEVVLVLANQLDNGKPWSLSPASVGCKIKGFRNNGGWGQEGLDYMIENGVVPTKLWPDNAISRTYDKPEAWAEAKRFVPQNWFDCKSRNFDEKASAHFQRIPTADGYNWWSHEVTGYEIVIVSNSIRDQSRRAIEKFAREINLDPLERDMRLELAGSKYGSRERNSWAMSYGDDGFFILAESKATPDDCCGPIDLLPA